MVFALMMPVGAGLSAPQRGHWGWFPPLPSSGWGDTLLIRLPKSRQLTHTHACMHAQTHTDTHTHTHTDTHLDGVDPLQRWYIINRLLYALKLFVDKTFVVFAVLEAPTIILSSNVWAYMLCYS